MDVVVVTVHNRFEERGRPCLESVRQHRPDAFLIVFDNQSEPEIPADHRLSDIWVRVDDQIAEGGLTGTWNRGVHMGIERDAQRILLLNDDTLIDESIGVLFDAMEDGHAYGPVTNNPGHAPWQHKDRWPGSFGSGLAGAPYLNGFCFGATAETWAQNRYGGVTEYIDPMRPFAGGEDEWIARLKQKGGQCWIVPGCYVFHHKDHLWEPIHRDMRNRGLAK